LEIAANSDGIFSVPIAFRNVSATAAINADLWVELSDGCAFASEPAGFDRPDGMPDNARHRMIALLNPETSSEKTILMVRTKGLVRTFGIGFKYACQACGTGSTKRQILTIENPIALNIGGTTGRSIISIPQ
jgi:hypothetical protein